MTVDRRKEFRVMSGFRMRFGVAIGVLVCSSVLVQATATFDPAGNQVRVTGGQNTLESIAQDLADQPGLFIYNPATKTAEFAGHYLTFGTAGTDTHVTLTAGQTLAFVNTAVNNRRLLMNKGVKWDLHDCTITGFVQIDMNSGDQSGNWINVKWIRTNEPSNAQFTPFRLRTNDETWDDTDPLIWKGGVVDTGGAINTFIPDPASSTYSEEPGFRRLDISDAEIVSRYSNVSVVNYYQSLGTTNPQNIRFNFTNCIFTFMNFDTNTGMYFQMQMQASPAIFNFVNVAWRRDGQGVPASQFVFDEIAENTGLGMIQLRAVNDQSSQALVYRYLDVQTVARDGTSPVNDIEVNATAKLANPVDDFLFLPVEIQNVPARTGQVAELGAGHTPLPPNSILVVDTAFEPDGTSTGYHAKILADVTAPYGGEASDLNPNQTWFRAMPLVPGGPDSVKLTLDVNPPVRVDEWNLY